MHRAARRAGAAKAKERRDAIRGEEDGERTPGSEVRRSEVARSLRGSSSVYRGIPGVPIFARANTGLVPPEAADIFGAFYVRSMWFPFTDSLARGSP